MAYSAVPAHVAPTLATIRSLNCACAIVAVRMITAMLNNIAAANLDLDVK